MQRETVVPGCVKCADHASCTGADNDVGDDALRLQRLDHADMRKTTCCAAAQREPDLYLARRFGLKDRLADDWRHRRGGSATGE